MEDGPRSPTRRRRFLAALGATALAGCSGLGGDPGGAGDGGAGDDGGDGTTDDPSETPSSERTPTATGTPVPADVSESTPPSATPLSPTPATTGATVDTPSADDPLRIGVLAPDPESFPMGRSMVEGARIAADRLADDGGPTGPPVELRVGNTEGAPGTGREEFLRLVREEKVDAVVGTYLTQVTLQCFQPMKAEETPLVTAGAAGVKPAKVVTDRYAEFKYHFRTGPLNTRLLGTATVEFLAAVADARGWDRVSVLVEEIAPFDPYAAVLDERLRDVVAVSSFHRQSLSADWSTLFDNETVSADDLVLVGQSLTGTGAVETWHDEERPFALGGLSGPLQATDAWGTTEGDAAGAFTLTTFCPRSRVGGGANEFVVRYLNRFGDQPEFTGAHAHDAVLALAAAARDVNSRDGETLVEALESVTVPESAVFAELSFRGPEAERFVHDPSWDGIASGVPQVAQWQEESLVPFHPEAAADGRYRRPPWLR